MEAMQVDGRWPDALAGVAPDDAPMAPSAAWRWQEPERSRPVAVPIKPWHVACETCGEDLQPTHIALSDITAMRHAVAAHAGADWTVFAMGRW